MACSRNLLCLPRITNFATSHTRARHGGRQRLSPGLFFGVRGDSVGHAATRPARQTIRWLSSTSARRRVDESISGIWYVPDPARTEASTVISRLPRLAEQHRAQLSEALILVTPKMAHWFTHDGVFLRDAINRMYGPVVAAGRSPTAFVAVVDGLPAPEYFADWEGKQDGPYALAEGFALCLSGKTEIVHKKEGDQDRPATLRLNSKPDPPVGQGTRGTSVESSLTIPLANTLFINGSLNTVFMLGWQADADGKSLEPRGGPTTLKGVGLVLNKPPKSLFDFHVPLHTLTVPRRVISSMGNIIREVEGDKDGEVLKASTELEAVVPKFLAQLDANGDASQIQVFAKVMPPDQLTNFDVSGNASQSRSSNERRNQTLAIGAGHGLSMDDLWDGSRFFRVTSGGGGWGKKAGLLSLNPTTSFDPVEATTLSMFPEFDADEVDLDSTTEAGDLIPNGHTIQFFAAKVQPSRSSTMSTSQGQSFDNQTLSREDAEWTTTKSPKWLFGTLISNEPNQLESHREASQSSSVNVLPGCFGAITEGGSAVRLLENGSHSVKVKNASSHPVQSSRLNEFRIDVPFATFRTMTETK